jgi:hypothetical protein
MKQSPLVCLRVCGSRFERRHDALAHGKELGFLFVLPSKKPCEILPFDQNLDAPKFIQGEHGFDKNIPSGRRCRANIQGRHD